MDQIKLEELAVAYPDQEDLVQVYKEWGDSAYLQELFKVLDSYEPDWNKEKELGSWAAEFLLDILEEEEWEEMTPEERTDRFNELLDERYEVFVVVISLPGSIILTSTFRKGKTWMLFWPRGTKRLCFPNWACKAWDEWI